MRANRIHPSPWRVLAAFLVVPGVMAIALAGVMVLYAGFVGGWEGFWVLARIFVLFGAYPSTVVLGVPAFFMLRKWLDATLVNCALVGATVAASPWLLLLLLPHGDYANVGGHATVIDGKSTAYGLLVAIELLGQIALIGAFSGILFWMIAIAGTKQIERFETSSSPRP